VRSAREAENVDITIVSIFCEAAKQAGKQYSKRILPPFVIPYCQIGREGVLRYLRQFPDGRLVYAQGLALLGARDKRTIRRHIALGLSWIGAAALELARLLSGLPAYGRLPQPRLSQSPTERLEELAHESERAAQRAGRTTTEVPPLVYVHLVSLFERSRRPLPLSLSCVLRTVVIPDTS
jgi:hypothetical protein